MPLGPWLSGHPQRYGSTVFTFICALMLGAFCQKDAEVQEVPNPQRIRGDPKPFEFHTCSNEVVINLDEDMGDFVLSMVDERGHYAEQDLDDSVVALKWDKWLHAGLIAAIDTYNDL